MSLDYNLILHFNFLSVEIYRFNTISMTNHEEKLNETKPYYLFWFYFVPFLLYTFDMF